MPRIDDPDEAPILPPGAAVAPVDVVLPVRPAVPSSWHPAEPPPNRQHPT